MKHYLPTLMPPGYISACGVLALLCIVVASLIGRRSASEASLRVADWIDLVGIYALLAFVVGVLSSSGVTLVEFYLPALFDSAWASVAAMVAGGLLFWLRKVKPARYAAIEILGALATMIVCGLSQYGTPYQRGTALLAATYFLIRGLDNADKGELHKKLINRAKGLLALGTRRLILIAFGILTIPVGMIASVASKRDLRPPYLDSARGGGVPVSALQCGNLWVVCDEAAWRRRELLLQGTAEDRRRDQIEVDARAHTYFRKHGITADP